jgi:glycerophosphoryl diester phosphodiesterase
VLPLRLPRWLRAVDARAATLNWAVVTPAVVAACHAAGAAVYVWTVNERELVGTLVKSDVDGIITDDPRLLAPGT